MKLLSIITTVLVLTTLHIILATLSKDYDTSNYYFIYFMLLLGVGNRLYKFFINLLKDSEMES
jgi:hypothetical protein